MIPTVQHIHQHAQACANAMVKKAAQEGMPCTCPGQGCSACCYEPAYVERHELEHALSRVTPQVRKQVQQRLIAWLALVEPSGLLKEEMPNAFRWRALRAPCPFLDVGQDSPHTSGYRSGRCAIYHDRPVSCRIHLACGPVESCYDDKAREHQRFIQSQEAIEHLGTMLPHLFRDVCYDNLGVLLAEILLRRPLKSASRREVRFQHQPQP